MIQGSGLLFFSPPPKERDRELQAKGLQDFPVGAQVGRPFTLADAVSRVVVGRVYVFQVPCWWVTHPDGDWDDFVVPTLLEGPQYAGWPMTRGGGHPPAAHSGRNRGPVARMARLTVGMPSLVRRQLCVGQFFFGGARAMVRGARVRHMEREQAVTRP